jgi:hypothetical protein
MYQQVNKRIATYFNYEKINTFGHKMTPKVKKSIKVEAQLLCRAIENCLKTFTMSFYTKFCSPKKELQCCKI